MCTFKNLEEILKTLRNHLVTLCVQKYFNLFPVAAKQDKADLFFKVKKFLLQFLNFFVMFLGY